MKYILLRFIAFYQKTASPTKKLLEHIGLLRNNSCVFYPTCSQYTKEAIKKYGVFYGIFLGFVRIVRCHPWQKNHMDPLK